MSAENDPLLGRPKGRRISFTSAGLCAGTFPKETNVCEPTINVALYFETCPSVHALEKVATKIIEYERCSGIPVGTDGKNDWHFHKLSNIPVSKLVRTFSASGDEDIHALIEKCVNDDELRASMTKNKSIMVERDGLPWFELVRFVNTGEGKSAVLLRVDHTIGDGFAVVNIFENIATYADGSPMSGLIPASMSKKFEKKGNLFAGIVMFFKVIVAFFRVLTLAASKFDDNFTFRKCVRKDMTFSGTRKQIVFPTVPLDFVKSLKDAQLEAGCDKSTVNDVMFAAVSQTIHDYCKSNNDPVLKEKGSKLQSRVLMPIALPRPKANETNRKTWLSNRWVLLSVDIGVGIDGAVERLKTITKTTAKLKCSPIALVQDFVQSKIAPLLPIAIARQTVYDTFVRHSMVLTNVPGPQKPAALGGEKIESCQLFFCNLVPNFNVLSYSGNIYCSVSVDPEDIPDAESLPTHFINSFVKLAEELNVDVPRSLSEAL